MGHTRIVTTTQTATADLALSVAGAAALVGLTPATLRTWDRRYGLSPSIRTTGGHRRYNADDITRLRLVAQLVEDGIPPAGAVQSAINATIADCEQRLRGDHSDRAPADDARAGGGRSISMPAASKEQRGLARAAMALDGQAVRNIMTSAIKERGVVAAWDEIAAPTLLAIGDHWEKTHANVEVEHVASLGIQQALSIDAPDRFTQRPTLLCCAPEDQHSLALVALRAAMLEAGAPAVMLGSRLPLDALAAAVKRLRPRAIVVWASMSENADVRAFDVVPEQRPPIRRYVAGPGWDGARLPDKDIQRLGSLEQALVQLTNPHD